jgi:hypothetical protein
MHFLFYKIPISYESRFPLDLSIQLLRDAVRSRWNPFPMVTGVYGKVSENSVRLYRVIPLWHNSFAPIFRGRFEVENGKVVLRGAYSTHPLVLAFAIIWLTVVIFAQAVMLFLAARLGTFQILYLIPSAMCLFLFFLIRTGKWLSRNDISYISGIIEESLGSGPGELQQFQ